MVILGHFWHLRGCNNFQVWKFVSLYKHCHFQIHFSHISLRRPIENSSNWGNVVAIFCVFITLADSEAQNASNSWIDAQGYLILNFRFYPAKTNNMNLLHLCTQKHLIITSDLATYFSGKLNCNSYHTPV